MVKKKGGRDMNPADAFRKKQREKEIKRNKQERQFLRDASKLRSDPSQIKSELQEVLTMEDDGKYNLTLKLKKKALQGALEASARKKKEDTTRAAQGDHAPFTAPHGHGVPEQQAEDSVYWHPTLNPDGKPPPGKPQRYRTSNMIEAAPHSGVTAVPLPKPPPLPKGPAPSASQADGSAQARLPPPSMTPLGMLPPPPFPPGAGRVLPPPDEPPPARPTLPPPDGPPPGMAGMLPPPPGPPPGMVMLPPPGMLPPGMLPPPDMPPPGFPPSSQAAAAAARESGAAAKPSVISGQATAQPRIPANRDRSLTSMVPASLRVRRDAAAKPRSGRDLLPARNAAPSMAPGFGLAPEAAPLRQAAPQRPAQKMAPPPEDTKYADFMADMAALGAIGA